MGTRGFVIGIDLGGTHLRSVLADDQGRILHKEKSLVGEHRSPDEVAGLIAGQVKKISKDAGERILAVGCGVPGIVDRSCGVVHASPHFPQWVNAPMRSLIEAATQLPVDIDNDANLHALGEATCGAGRGIRNVIVMTLGTGIGGGLIFDGEIFHGDSGFAGEIGHIVVEPDGPACGCGGRGCLEIYAASNAFALHASRLVANERDELVRAAGTRIEALTPEIAARLADEGNRTAIALWERFGEYLGVGIATLMNVLGVMTFVVGGGISRSFDKFAAAAGRSALAHTFRHHASSLVIRKAELGDEAGLIGAVHAARSAAGLILPRKNQPA